MTCAGVFGLFVPCGPVFGGVGFGVFGWMVGLSVWLYMGEYFLYSSSETGFES